MTYRFTEEQRQEMKKKYEETLSATDVAKDFEVSRDRIVKELKGMGVKIRGRGNRKNHTKRISHGLYKHPLYATWKLIKQRCNNPNCRDYHNYGGRGITIAEEWINDFQLFLFYIDQVLGDKPQGKSLDRINNDKGYEPGNIRWASEATQASNKRINILTEEQAQMLREAHHSVRSEEAKSVKRLAREWGIDYSHAKRVSRGESWAVEI